LRLWYGGKSGSRTAALQSSKNKMPGFPTQIVGTPTIRGKARRYKVGESGSPEAGAL